MKLTGVNQQFPKNKQSSKLNPDIEVLGSTQGIIKHIDINNHRNSSPTGSYATVHSPGHSRPFDGTLKKNQDQIMDQ